VSVLVIPTQKHNGDMRVWILLIALTATCTLSSFIAGPRDIREGLRIRHESENQISKRQTQFTAPMISAPGAIIGPAKSDIINSSWVLVPGIPPSLINGDVFLRSGLFDHANRDDGDSLQVRSLPLRLEVENPLD
jgi:hypothetical protein